MKNKISNKMLEQNSGVAEFSSRPKTRQACFCPRKNTEFTKKT